MHKYQDYVDYINANPKEPFVESKQVVGGYNVSIFNYFVNPEKFTDFTREMRGLVFIHNEGKSVIYPMLPKFHNINENDENCISVVREKKIARVQEKLDGSFIAFVRFPDGEYYAKSKSTFESDHAKWAQDIYEKNKAHYKGIFDQHPNKIFMFELVGSANKVVIDYNCDLELRLLQVRDRITGEFDMTTNFGFPTAGDYTDASVESLYESAKTQKQHEGWVVTFDDGSMLKIKTAWYFALHRLIGDLYGFAKIAYFSYINDSYDDLYSVDNDPDLKKHLGEMHKYLSQTFGNMADSVVDFVMGLDPELHRKDVFVLGSNRIDTPVIMGLVSEIEQDETLRTDRARLKMSAMKRLFVLFSKKSYATDIIEHIRKNILKLDNRGMGI